MAVSDIKEIRIFPPLAISRFGSSPEPMDNYELGEPEGDTGFRKLIPEETLVIQNGKISEIITPTEVKFRDDEGRVKPVAPFFEVWAKFEENGEFVPLTKEHVENLNAIQVTIEMGNYKVARRTGNVNDQVNATASMDGPNTKSIQGKSTNFIDNKFIDFGKVQFIEPTDEFDTIRIRYTPPAGIVYGHREDGIAIQNNEADRQVYNEASGNWIKYPWEDTADNYPLTVLPTRTIAMEHNERGQTLNRAGNIYQGRAQERGTENNYPVHLGYLDDSCDGIITVEIKNGNLDPLTSYARVTAGPPDFAPQQLHVRHILDDMHQFNLGVDVKAGDEDLNIETAIDMVQRAKETVLLMDSETLDSRFGRFPDETSTPDIYVTKVKNSTVLAIHNGVLATLEGLRSDDVDTRNRAKNYINTALIPNLRKFTEVGDERITDRVGGILQGAQKMPALMRGARAENLAVTRRLISVLEYISKKEEDNQGDEPADQGSNEEETRFIKLIEYLSDKENASMFHGGKPGIGDQSLSQLFSDPSMMITYLKQNSATINGQVDDRLVVAGEPQNSAFYLMITQTVPFMKSKFESYEDDTTGENGIQIVNDWIMSLPNE